MKGISLVLYFAGILATNHVEGARAQQRPLASLVPFPLAFLDSAYESGSPDGKMVVYHKAPSMGRIYLRDLSNGSERLLLDVEGSITQFAWSGDSRQLAITVEAKKAPTSDVRVITIATGASRSLGTPGTVLAWTSKGDILINRPIPFMCCGWYLVPAGGGKPKLLQAGYGTAVLTPDNKSLIYIGTGGRLILHRLADGAERTVTAAFGQEAMPTVSPDGRLLAFASNQDGTWALYVAPMDNLPIRAPVRIASLDGRPQAQISWWTSKGDLALRPTYFEGPLYRIDMDPGSGHSTGSPRRLTHDPADLDYPIVAPDNRTVAYAWDGTTTGGIRTIDPTGTEARTVLTRGSQPPTPIAWRSPEELIVYDDAGETPGFAVLNIGTRALRTLTPAKLDRHNFAFVPQRQEMLYAEGPNSSKGVLVKALSLTGGKERLIATIDYLHSFTVSPDGQHIAYVRWANGQKSPGEIRTMSIDGQQESLLHTESKPDDWSTVGAWSPDGKFLLYFDPDDAARVMNVATHESWPLVKGDDLPDWSEYDDATWSPDGSFIVLPGDGTWKDPQLRKWVGISYDTVVRLMKAAKRPPEE